jgi:hypothetical protein
MRERERCVREADRERERERGVIGRLTVKEREREVNCYNDKKKIILKKL